jgi:hypothetical protein
VKQQDNSNEVATHQSIHFSKQITTMDLSYEKLLSQSHPVTVEMIPNKGIFFFEHFKSIIDMFDRLLSLVSSSKVVV